MNFPKVSGGLLMMALTVMPACGGSSSSGTDAGGQDAGSGGQDAGGAKLGQNPSVTQTCQQCLSQSSGNECSDWAKTCNNGSACVGLNTCINNCTNVNTACVTSCGQAASQNAITEWTQWSQCACNSCAAQCGSTFCGAVGGDAGSCTPDNTQCPAGGGGCCTFCASDGYCGCIPSGQQGCQTSGDCCSQSCGGGGVCN
jgi:hypothetical protein